MHKGNTSLLRKHVIIMRLHPWRQRRHVFIAETRAAQRTSHANKRPHTQRFSITLRNISAKTSIGNFSDCHTAIMAFFYLAAAGAGAWLFGSYVYGLRQAQRSPLDPEAVSGQPESYFGGIGHISKWIHSDLRQFHSVEKSVDEQGATIFLVDYGSGARTIQYIDPRILQ